MERFSVVKGWVHRGIEPAFLTTINASMDLDTLFGGVEGSWHLRIRTKCVH